MDKDPFKEYIKESEPGKRDKGYAWHTAIGLQAVDGLKTSQYLVDTAIRNIEGDISIDEASELLNSYYEENPNSDNGDRTEEADKVALRIAKILSEKAFSFTPNEYISIHKKLFVGIYTHAGKIRDYNITKKELLDEKNELHNRSMHISGLLKADVEDVKANIENAKANIEDSKANIERLLMNIEDGIKCKTIMHVIALYEECGRDNIFGRSFVEKVTGLKSTRASEIIKLMMEKDVIEAVKGHGKGKYRFK